MEVCVVAARVKARRSWEGDRRHPQKEREDGSILESNNLFRTLEKAGNSETDYTISAQHSVYDNIGNIGNLGLTRTNGRSQSEKEVKTNG
jgi:hypothetical protein